ncbi:unnamed protein product [Owenia fusiformis]|uniref:Uncharacterized protein n=1 Tax=Owenia fusiformis TaxID=6347 RepID=A0A8J1UPN5_OWEFU|nr:unnamed protein product [Owenia fusiformis]
MENSTENLNWKLNTTNSSVEILQFTYKPYIEESPGKFAVLVLFAATFCFLGVFGNVLTIISIVKEEVLRVPENCFIISRAISDIILAGMILPLTIAGVVKGEAYYHQRATLCKALAGICCLVCFCNWWTLASLSVNRLFLTWFPLKSRAILTWRTTPALSMFCYVIGFCVVSPALFGWSVLEFDPEMMVCMVDVDTLHYNTFIVLANAIPSSITFVTLVLTAIKMNSKRRQFAVVGPEVDVMESTAFVSDNEDKSKAKQLLKELRDAAMSVKMIASLFGVTFLLWLPLTVVMLSHHALNYGRDIWAFSLLVAHLQPGVDCFCYVFVNRYFRRGYKNVVCFVFCGWSNGKCICSS